MKKIITQGLQIAAIKNRVCGHAHNQSFNITEFNNIKTLVKLVEK